MQPDKGRETVEEIAYLATAAAFLRKWMTDVMQEREWNAQEWARKASTSPTNITRFLRGSDHIPSYATLIKLAIAAGKPIPTPGLAQRDLPKVRIPLLQHSQIPVGAVADLAALTRRARQEVVADWHGPKAFAIKLDTGKFAGLGYEPGDILVVDPDVVPVAGKHVLASNGIGTGPCRYEPPFIFCVAGKRRIKLDKTIVIGTVVELIRRMM
jgi:transcriptional regulator with XRE-family HTH domain